MTNKEDKGQPNVEDCATAWFAVLERARLDDDYERATAAVRELRRLGVTVTFSGRGKGGRHAR
jgi:hypothetical protein